MKRTASFVAFVVITLVAVAATTAGCGGAAQVGDGGAELVKMLTTTVPAGTTGVEYQTTYAADFPHPAGAQFAKTGGTLPPGLALDPQSGELSGYPRLVGTFQFEIAARDGVDPALPPTRDANYSEDRQAFSLVVGRGPPNILTQTLPGAQYRATFGFLIDCVGGRAPYSFEITAGSLPPGISFTSDGFLSGFPTSAALPSWPFTVEVTDADGLTDSQDLSLSVFVLPLIILTSNVPAGAKDFAYDAKFDLASPGAGAPFVWSQKMPVTGTDTDLADIKMQISSDGHLKPLSGFPGPSSVGTFTFIVQVTDESLQVSERPYTFVVSGGPTLTSITPKYSYLPGPYVVKGLNFQPGAALVFNPGGTPFSITPQWDDDTTMQFNSVPTPPPGVGGSLAVRVVNPDGGFHTLPDGFLFAFQNLAFGAKGFLTSNLSSTGLAVGDLTGDGKAEIVHAGATNVNAYPGPVLGTAAGLVLHVNLGGLSFTSQTLDTANYYDVEIVDVNTDGKPDIVAVNQTSVRTWLNGVAGPLGTFTTPPGTTSTLNITSGHQPSDFEFGFLNGDTIPDFVYGAPNYVSTAYGGGLFSMYGTGNGGFTALDTVSTGLVSAVLNNATSYSNGVPAVALGDLNADGRSDAVAGTNLAVAYGPFFRWSYTQSSGAFGTWAGTAQAPPVYFPTLGLAVGNFTGDGSMSVVTASSPSESYIANYPTSIALFTGSNLVTQVALTQPANTPTSRMKYIGTGDFDLNGKPDFAVGVDPGQVTVYRGGTAIPQKMTDLNFATGSPTISSPKTGRIASGDLDGDGRPDLVATMSCWNYDCGGVYSNSTTYYHAWNGDGGSKGIGWFLNASN